MKVLRKSRHPDVNLIKALLFGKGDLNAFCGLVIDNMTQLVIMAAVLVKVFHFPREMVYSRMIPGSAIGVFVGNIAYTLMALSLARRTGRKEVTAMPLGIDTPSLFAFIFGVIGPAHAATGDPVLAWKISMAVVVIVGLVKTLGSFLGPLIQRSVPQAGLLGPIAGVALLLISFLPLVKIFKDPLTGFMSLIIVLCCLIGKLRFPFRIPAALGGVLLGVIISYSLRLFGEGPPLPSFSEGLQQMSLSFPLPSLGFLEGLPYVMNYLPLALPFAIVVIIGGIDVTESAAVAGDHYHPRTILMVSGLSTLFSGLCGGVLQTTPFIGHPAYKEMGGRAGYTLWTALFIGLGGIFGTLGLMVDFLPEAALAPVLIFIGLEITAEVFSVTPARHYPALAFSFLPAIAQLVFIELNGLLTHLGKRFSDLSGEMALSFQTIQMLANGFIISSLIWGAALALIIDKALERAAFFFGIAALASLFGIIHSPFPDGRLFLPWRIESSFPLRLSSAYGLMVVLLLLMAGYQKKRVGQAGISTL